MTCQQLPQLALFASEEIPDLRTGRVKDFRVMTAERGHIEKFVEENHYSGSINGVIADYCFRLCWGNHIIGAAIFGRLAMANQWKRFGEQEADVIELRRLCCIDNTPRNTESYFIGKTLRWLAKNTKHKVVVSYADAEYGHRGTIYRASNFQYLGLSAGAKVIMHNGKRYHDKSIRTKHNGELKPFAKELSVALGTGEACYKETAGKHTYVYPLAG